MADDTKARLLELAKEKFSTDAASVTLQSTMSDLDADSLDMMEFVFEVEEIFSIDLDPDALKENFSSIEEGLDYIISQIRQHETHE